MNAVCRKCGLVWNISIRSKIGKKGYTCPRCEFKSKIKKNMYVFTGFIISCLLVFKAKDLAYSQRGYTAAGGEYLIPVIYLAIVGFIKSVSDIKKENALDRGD